MTEKTDFLKTYLSLYINFNDVLANLDNPDSPYIVVDVRNAPAQAKKTQIKGAKVIPAKDLATRLDELDHQKTIVVYDWNGGTILGKVALLTLLSHDFKAFELAGDFEGWAGMNLPTEPAQ